MNHPHIRPLRVYLSYRVGYIILAGNTHLSPTIIVLYSHMIDFVMNTIVLAADR